MITSHYQINKLEIWHSFQNPNLRQIWIDIYSAYRLLELLTTNEKYGMINDDIKKCLNYNPREIDFEDGRRLCHIMTIPADRLTINSTSGYLFISMDYETGNITINNAEQININGYESHAIYEQLNKISLQV